MVHSPMKSLRVPIAKWRKTLLLTARCLLLTALFQIEYEACEKVASDLDSGHFVDFSAGFLQLHAWSEN